ncbi:MULTISPECIES: hypothetical protein [unclassified Bradyrhizobium]|uniref:hypothetical protein n=1 Tax=unclassified Bradyrhizobium TaxID=2631580 RepID=UPI002FF23AEF
MAKSTVGHHMKRAARLGMTGYEPAQDGFEVRSVKTTTGGGILKSQTIVPGHEAGPRFSELPPGDVHRSDDGQLRR